MAELNEINRRFRLEIGEARLQEAFTHRSYAVEHNLSYDNQRLEFLGDSVLEIILSEYLFLRYPEAAEGDLTKIRSALACEEALARMARECALGEFLRTGRGEAEIGGAWRNSTLADLFEALIGAIYLDCGFDAARTFAVTALEREFPDPKELLEELNPKGKLQELSQQRWGGTPEYTVFRLGGPQHRPIYEVEAVLRRFCALGSGKSRKAAESDAARKLYFYLKYQEDAR